MTLRGVSMAAALAGGLGAVAKKKAAAKKTIARKAAASSAKPWYKKPITWIVGAVVLVGGYMLIAKGKPKPPLAATRGGA